MEWRGVRLREGAGGRGRGEDGEEVTPLLFSVTPGGQQVGAPAPYNTQGARTGGSGWPGLSPGVSGASLSSPGGAWKRGDAGPPIRFCSRPLPRPARLAEKKPFRPRLRRARARAAGL